MHNPGFVKKQEKKNNPAGKNYVYKKGKKESSGITPEKRIVTRQTLYLIIMERNLKEALKHRRSYYNLGNESPLGDEEIADILKFALTYIPSAFNSQSARLVLLLGENHRKLWEIVKSTLKKIVPEASYEASEHKIDKSFLSGYGTVLFYEDQTVVEYLQKSFPLYGDKFPDWSQQASAMHQLAVWTMLEDAGFGASLQHYNPLIDDEVAATWQLPQSWHLIAQMPFGKPLQIPAPHENKPLEERLRVFQ